MAARTGAGTVAVIATGAANTASVLAALARLGAEPRLVDRPEEVADAARLVLPGVGAFAAVVDGLHRRGLWQPLAARLAAGRPTLAVCLGLQLLAEGSEESPGVAGLGLVPGLARRFPAEVRVPQLGWNRVEPPGGGLVRPGAAYYANSYRLESAPEDWSPSYSEHGGRFVAALERGAVLATQFHPELSGAWGSDLLARWLESPGSAPTSPRLSAAATRRGGSSALMPRLIPCLDVDGGRVVKGVRFADLVDAGDPAACAARYAAEGADELVLLDVSATPGGRGHALETVRAVRAVLPLPLTVGGGVRSVVDAAALLDAGADKVAVNTAAVARPELLAELAARFGCQCVVLAVDARRTGAGWEVVVRSGRDGTGRDAIAWAAEGARRGAGEILLTAWDRDGTGAGYDLEVVAAVAAAVAVPVVASGGAAGPEHMTRALAAGADAVLAAGILHRGEWTVGELKQALAAAGVEVRQ